VKRRVWLILIILFGFGALLIWRPFMSADPSVTTTAPDQLEPDFTASGLASRIFDNNGKLMHRIQAQTMAHFSTIGMTELGRPVYWVYTNGDVPTWRVEAEMGSFYDDETLVLENRVTITNLVEDDDVERIETEYLVVDMSDEQMTTDRPVTIIGVNYQVRGNGMKADLAADKLELYQHVETFYTRPDQP